MNKYYIVITDSRDLFGPYTFKKAIKEQNYWREFSVTTIILKEVVDIDGKEVKE